MADLPALEAFVAIARTGSVVRAARVLHRTQPSLSARLAGLERHWGTRLFRREARGVSLTPEGRTLLPLAEAALEAVARVDRAAGLPLAGGRELRVGAGDALGRDALPRALAALLEHDPEIAVRLVEGPTGTLLGALEAGEIDVALVADLEGRERPGLETEPLFESAVELLLPAGERAPKTAARLESLRDRRLVTLQPGSAFRRHVEAAFAAAGVPFRPAVEVGNLSLVRRFVAAGLGAGIVPAVAFRERDPAPGTTRRPLRGIPKVGYVAARRAGVPTAPATRHLLELLRRQ